jgi:hypothetical protein
MTFEHTEERLTKWRAMVAVCQKSKKKWLFDVFSELCWRFVARKLADSSRILLVMS